MNIKVIGLGGIGSHLVSPLCRHIDASKGEAYQVTVIDGDNYEARNADRQEFLDVGNKAEVTVQRMKRDFPELAIEAKPQFVTEENIFFMINAGDIVLLGVDNHATRKLVSDHCRTLDDVVLISGGNELMDGNVQIYVRRGGRSILPPITYLHPEIEKPSDRNPAELGCEELARMGVPQLIFTNLTAAVLMLSAFRMVCSFLSGSGKLVYSEQYFDLTTGNTQAILRKAV
ncbi:MAG: ThiF family adenylyltransferase [Candidatus Pacebacteria bacterium]|nr:ThiF family adenylyltransferase [Candidatus Paceibacterota bacterium]